VSTLCFSLKAQPFNEKIIKSFLLLSAGIATFGAVWPGQLIFDSKRSYMFEVVD
jgi:hypothetical protein